MKRSIKIGLLLALVVLSISLGYIAYEHRDIIVQYFSEPEIIPDQNEEQQPEEIAPALAGRVVFLGDSITYRWDMPEVIGEYQAINQGIDGNNTTAMVKRFKEDVIELEPDRVVILGGINDILFAAQYDLILLDMHLEITARNLKSMTSMSKKAGIEPILCSVLPVASNYHFPPDKINQAVQRLNSSIKEIAVQEKVEYLDLWPIFAEPDTKMLKDDYATADGLHLSPQGYAEMLQAFTALMI